MSDVVVDDQHAEEVLNPCVSIRQPAIRRGIDDSVGEDDVRLDDLPATEQKPGGPMTHDLLRGGTIPCDDRKRQANGRAR